MATIHGWFPISAEISRLICRSPAFELLEHYVDDRGRSARCGGGGCVLCGLYPTRRSLVIAVSERSDGQVRILRVPEQCAALHPELVTLEEDLVGHLIHACWLGRTANEGMELHLVKQVSARPVPVAKYIAAIGRREYDRCASVLQV
jgi:hypothetical protein